MGSESQSPGYRVYRGGEGETATPDEAALERIAALGGSAAAVDGAVVEEPAGPRVRPGGPIVLPEPGAPPPERVPGPPPPVRPRRRKRSRGKLIGLAALGCFLLAFLWIGYGYWTLRGAMDEANARVTTETRAALTPQAGSLLRTPTTLLVLGSDSRGQGDRGRSDSILLVRSDPGRNRMAMLSIPRDLRVPIPGVGEDKINAAYAAGGAPLAIKTVQELVGVPINHVALVDFDGFEDLVDELGGITIDNPSKIISNEFDGYAWRFGKGELHLDGRHALAYARVRKNTVDQSDSDVTRGDRQKRVMDAIASDLASPGTLFGLPGVADAVAKPLTTTLSANDLMWLGWRRFRSSRTLSCRLGGTPVAGSYLSGGEENRQTVAMWMGGSAPQPPRPGDPFAPGCTVS